MTKEPLFFYPKGSMCMSCQHADRDCSHLNFQGMPVIERHSIMAFVRCIEYVKAGQP